jgi:hypothetical protein
VTFVLDIFGVLFVRGDGSAAPDPASGRIYPVIWSSRSGGHPVAYVDHAGAIFFQLFTWPIIIVGGLLAASILFERARDRWRAKNEGRPPRSPGG